MAGILEKFSLIGKKALIVCPENPYSREIAAGLADAGAEIWIAGEKETEIGINIAGRFKYIHGSKDSATELAEAVRQRMGVLDIVVENGLYTEKIGWKQSFDEINEQLNRTHLGMMLTVQSLGSILACQGHGSVILVTDYGALVGYDPVNYTECPEQASTDFSLVKGFISGGAVNYARQASNYLAEHGCRCNTMAIAPSEGSCSDSFAKAYIHRTQVKRLARAEDIAAAAVFLASDASQFITGITLPVDGGYTAK